ncbi:hypothetical protein [Microbacterium sp. C7(2022)]|nr:hypothetical protein [Microbacterium sp. C7(2022)]
MIVDLLTAQRTQTEAEVAALVAEAKLTVSGQWVFGGDGGI